MTAPAPEPFIAGRGMYGWNYASDAVRHIEEHNCAHGCTIPDPASIEEFGPGGNCHLLALLFTGDPIDDFHRTDTHVICRARTTELPGQTNLLDLA